MTGAGVPDLPPHLKAVLRFEARHAGKSDATLTPLVRQAFGVGLLRYRQRLVVAVKAPGAEAVEPAVVRRLREVLERRRNRYVRKQPPTTPRGV